MSAARHMAVRLIAGEAPFAPGDGIGLALQHRNGEFDQVAAASGTVTFETTIEWTSPPDEFDVKGDHVTGRRGDRFVYVAWGVAGDDSFEMFARAKLRFVHVPDELFVDGATLVGEFAAVNRRGEPASGTITPPEVAWHIEA